MNASVNSLGYIVVFKGSIFINKVKDLRRISFYAYAIISNYPNIHQIKDKLGKCSLFSLICKQNFAQNKLKIIDATNYYAFNY